jgi:transcription elongation factor GreB
MSRAFVRESDVPQLPELPPLVSPLPPGAKNFLTAAGAARLQAELAGLLGEQRPRFAAAAPDDLDAKRELQLLDQRIRYLQASLRTAEVVAVTAPPPTVVQFGATVTVREAGAEPETYRIVGVDETDLGAGRVSWLSPLARALLNAHVGDRVALRTPRGTRELDVVRLAYEP